MLQLPALLALAAALLVGCGGAPRARNDELPAPPRVEASASATAYDGGSSRADAGTTAARASHRYANGRLAPELIQRVVRAHFGVLRECYEAGLGRDSNLRGRVTTKFVIDRSGAVAMTADGGSDMPDHGVVECVVRAFGSLIFPQPEGGMVTVVYPIMFNPSD